MNARKVSRTEKVQNSGPELKKCREVDILFKFYLRPISEDRSADFRFWLGLQFPVHTQVIVLEVELNPHNRGIGEG